MGWSQVCLFVGLGFILDGEGVNVFQHNKGLSVGAVGLASGDKLDALEAVARNNIAQVYTCTLIKGVMLIN